MRPNMRLMWRMLTPIAFAVLLAVAGCGGEGGTAGEPASPSPTATTAASPSPTETSPSPTDTGTVVTVEMTDFRLTLSQSSFTPGTYTFVAEEKGQAPHALAIRGPGVEAATPVVQPGGASQRLTVTLQSGEYQMWCPVGNHQQRGMELTLTVS